MMRAIICSTDGLPQTVCVVNEDHDVRETLAALRKARLYDRIDVLAVDTLDYLLSELAEEQD